MNAIYKVFLVSTIILTLPLSACGTATARGLQDIEGGDRSSPGDDRGGQSQDDQTTVIESYQAEVGAPVPEAPLSAEDPEGIPSIEERNEMLGGVNLGIDQPVEEEAPTGPEPGTETGPPGSPGEVPSTELDDVNLGIEQSEDTATNFIDVIISTIRQFFSSILTSSETSEAFAN